MSVVQSTEEHKQPEQAETDTTLDTDTALGKETAVSKTNESANNSFENMESLLLNEDDDDDPICTDSLLMSNSEGEEGEHISPVRRKKPAPKIFDSEDEDGAKQEENTNEKPPDDKKDRDGDEEAVHKAYKPKKFSALIDSDSEMEDTPEEEDRLKDRIDSDNAVEESREEKKEKRIKKNKKVKKIKDKSRSPTMSSDSEVETEEPSQKKNSNISNLIDSDSDSSIASDAENEQDSQSQEQNEGDASAQRPKKPQRASAQKAINEMQAIQSETQRLYRETQVSIPYHKPKRHTLKEFLTRHTIEKPHIGEERSGKSLKMTPEELEAYAKHLEERAKEATEFFKSESEDELEDIAQCDQENEKEQEPVTPVIEAMDLEEPSKVTSPSKDDIDSLVESGPTSLPTTQELIDLEMQQESEPIASTTRAAVSKETQPIASRLFELKRRLIAEKNLSPTPTLKGGPNMMIDFESGDIVPSKPTGLESLFQRFLKSNVNNKKPKERVLMTERASDKPKINVCVIEEPNKEKEPKPGAAYVKLKESLRTLITKKRKEDFQKKIEETQEEELEYKKCCGLDDDDDDEEDDAIERESRRKKAEKDIVIDNEENEIELLNDEEDVEEEDESEDEPCEIDEEAKGTQLTNENEENASDNDEEDALEADDVEEAAVEEDSVEEDEEDSDSDEEQANNDPLTRKHRVIKAFEDSDDEKDELGTDLNATITSILFGEEDEKNPEEVENELLGLCSGQFEESQRPPIITQIPITQTPGVAQDAELMNLCSGAFNEESTQVKEIPKEKQMTVMKILSSDEEEKELEKEKELTNATKKVKRLRKKQKKRTKLGFSDDEDEDEEEQDLQDYYEEEEDEVPQTFIDYDSEENEIEVQMSKKECVKQANAFLEKEAELSESEWGSADEDEQNLDKYDMELGDEDEFDREKIRAELGQIHMRKVLDDDIREVKKIQELLFDDEEADGVGRQRQFRWKNIENGFSLDDATGGDPNNNDGIDSADDEEEMKWRKMRFDREQLLKQKTKEEILAEVSATALGRTLLSTMEPDVESNMVYQPQVLVEKEYKAPSFLIAQCDVKSMRGSFLNYDKETLALIAAAATKSGVHNEDEPMQHKASKTGNFVFAPLSEEEQTLRKRKAEKGHNVESGNIVKKMKPAKSLLLDKLL